MSKLAQYLLLGLMSVGLWLVGVALGSYELTWAGAVMTYLFAALHAYRWFTRGWDD